jgi:hypothetical protein
MSEEADKESVVTIGILGVHGSHIFDAKDVVSYVSG